MRLQERRVEGVQDRPPIHVLRDRQPEERQERRSDVQDRGLLQVMVLAERRAVQDHNTVLAVPVGRLAETNA